MGRTSDPSIRLALRDKAVGYVLANGLADLSLRPLAAALGTNARMLVYHFGSRQGLMRAILTGLREREGARVAAWFRARRPRTISGFIRWYWKRLSTPEAAPAARLIFELYALALRNPAAYPGVLEEPLPFWQRLLAEAGVRSERERVVLATLILATTRGLLLDLTASGDVARTTRALVRLSRVAVKKRRRPRFE